MKSLLLASTLAIAALTAPANAYFEVRGVMSDLLKDGAVTCEAYTKWRRTAPQHKQDVMNQWVLGFFGGLESQIHQKPEYATATGSERPHALLPALTEACKAHPKDQVMFWIRIAVEVELAHSAKNPNPAYEPGGYNVHGLPAAKTCQDLTALAARRDQKRQLYLYEEWMLGAATGIESQMLAGTKVTTEVVTNEEFLEGVYRLCEKNPQTYVFPVVRDWTVTIIDKLYPTN